jgi:hypothetical protein
MKLVNTLEIKGLNKLNNVKTYLDFHVETFNVYHG